MKRTTESKGSVKDQTGIDEKYKGKKVYFTSIDNAQFRRKVVPGDTLELYVELISFRHNIGKGAARAEINGETVCSAELGFVIA